MKFASLKRHRVRPEFLARAVEARDELRRTGVTFAADDVHAALARKLDHARARLRKKTRA